MMGLVEGILRIEDTPLQFVKYKNNKRPDFSGLLLLTMLVTNIILLFAYTAKEGGGYFDPTFEFACSWSNVDAYRQKISRALLLK